MAHRNPIVLMAGCALAGWSCSDQKLDVHWDESSVSILAPASGATWTQGVPLTLEARLSVDARHSAEELNVAWSSDVEGPLDGEATVVEDGATLVVESLQPGSHTVEVVLTDPRNSTATDAITLEVVANTAPSAAITAPLEGDVVAAGEGFDLRAEFGDATEPDLSALSLSWTLDGAAWSDGPAHPDADGGVDLEPDAPGLGEHTLSVTVTDGPGLTAEASVRFEVVERDADGDGYDNARLGGDDCDDENADIHPGATEVCDDEGIDEDCNGLADDDDPGVVGQQEVWPDEDGDDWGAEGAERTTCDTEGMVSRGGDCDDANELVHPEATEVCDDGLDNDCNGDPSECWLSGDYAVEVADAIVWGMSGSDELGGALEGGDLDGDGYADLIVGAVNEATTASGAGVVYMLPGPLPPGAMAVEDLGPSMWFGDASGDSLGIAVSIPADLDGDGLSDLLMGAPMVDQDRLNVGALYIAAGPFSAGTQTKTLVAEGDQSGGLLGSALDVGDFNCDGSPDILAGEPNSNAAFSDGGAAHVWYGPISASATSSETSFTALPGSSGDNLGTSVRNVGDVSGDGCDDLVMGAPDHNVSYSNDGALYLFLGSSGLAGTVSASSADVMVVGTEAGEKLGSVAGHIGDIDGARYADLAVPVPERDNGAGAVWVFHSPIASSFPATLDISSADLELTGDRPGDSVGSSVHGGVDVEGDGCVDLFVGAMQHENDAGLDNRGASFFMSCPASTAVSGGIDSTYTARFGGDSAYQHVGAAVRILEDLTGDGRPELATGAPQADATRSNVGAVYLFDGRGE